MEPKHQCHTRQKNKKLPRLLLEIQSQPRWNKSTQVYPKQQFKSNRGQLQQQYANLISKSSFCKRWQVFHQMQVGSNVHRQPQLQTEQMRQESKRNWKYLISLSKSLMKILLSIKLPQNKQKTSSKNLNWLPKSNYLKQLNAII